MFSRPKTTFNVSIGLMFIWRESFTVGHPTIDADHRHLFKIANRVLFEASTGRNRVALSLSLMELMDAVSQHFRQEERLFEASPYPNKDHHKQEHRKLELDLKQTMIKIVSGDLARLSGDLRATLERWVVQHMMVQDRDLQPYLQKGLAPGPELETEMAKSNELEVAR